MILHRNVRDSSPMDNWEQVYIYLNQEVKRGRLPKDLLAEAVQTLRQTGEYAVHYAEQSSTYKVVP